MRVQRFKDLDELHWPVGLLQFWYLRFRIDAIARRVSCAEGLRTFHNTAPASKPRPQVNFTKSDHCRFKGSTIHKSYWNGHFPLQYGVESGVEWFRVCIRISFTLSISQSHSPTSLAQSNIPNIMRKGIL